MRFATSLRKIDRAAGSARRASVTTPNRAVAFKDGLSVSSTRCGAAARMAINTASLTKAGYSLGSSLSFLLVMNFGAIFGAVGGGWLGDRFNLPRVLAVFFALSAGSIGLLGFNSPSWVLYSLIAVAGATTIGSQILLYACGAQFYGLAIRSTGLGWASGVGRNGAIVGPVLGGALMGLGVPLSANFLAFALPGVFACLAMLAFNWGGLQGAPKQAPIRPRDAGSIGVTART